MSTKPSPVCTESRSWRPNEHVDLADDAAVVALAARLCVTPGELREIIEEMGDRWAPVAIEAGPVSQALGVHERHGAAE